VPVGGFAGEHNLLTTAKYVRHTSPQATGQHGLHLTIPSDVAALLEIISGQSTPGRLSLKRQAPAAGLPGAETASVQRAATVRMLTFVRECWQPAVTP
jgi:hypothetical protein